MKKFGKRMMSLLICMAMMTALISGCGKKDAGNTTDAGSQTSAAGTTQAASQGGEDASKEAAFPLAELVTMSLGLYQVPGTDVTKTLTLTEMEKKTNIKWDYHPFGEDIKDKLPLEFGSGEYKDVYLRVGLSAMDIAKYAGQGVVIPLNDLIEQYMPNLKAALDEKNLWNYLISEDGQIYSLPQIGDKEAGMLMFVNKPWMEQLNIEEPKTAEDFLNMLRTFKNSDANGNGKADELPLVLCKDMLGFLPQYFGIASDVISGSATSFENGKAEFYPATEKYKEYLSILRTMVEEGLVNSDYETIGWQDQEAMTMTSDNVGAFLHWGGYLGVGSERDEDFPGLTPLNESNMVVSSGFQGGGLVITDKCEHPELVAQWADYFYSEEGGRLLWMGLEGESYKLSDDGQTYSWVTDGPWGDNQTTILESATLMGQMADPVLIPPIYNAGNQNPDESFLWKQRRVAIDSSNPLPVLTWTDAESKERSTYLADIQPYVDQYRAAVATGDQDLDTTWDEYINTLNQMQLKRLVEIDQAAYDRFLSRDK